MVDSCLLVGRADRGRLRRGRTRDLVVPPQPALLAVLLVALPNLLQFVRMEWVPWWLVAACVLASATWLTIAHPLTLATDAVTAVLAIQVAHIMVTAGPRAGLAVTAASLVLFVATAGFDDFVAICMVEVLFGTAVGAMLRWQMRALAAERAARAGEHDRATLAERQRIAREIHDLVGHSLSVTLLHVTGARRALREDGDIEEAVAALTDAERVGRTAMADIRGTVGVLTTGREDTRPLPTAADVNDLVDELRAAGLVVDYKATGSVATLPPSVGLGIYRVVQGVAGERRQARAGDSGPGSARRDLWPGAGASEQPAPGPESRPERGRDGRNRHGVACGAARRHPARRAGQRPVGGRHDRAGHMIDSPVPVRVILVDDQELVRSGLRRILRRRDGFEIVAEYADGADLPATVSGADVVVMDLRMRRVDGIEATRRIRHNADGPPVLALTTFDDDEMLSGALRAGAAGFVLKDSSAEDLIRAVRTVAGGGSWLDPSVTGRVLNAYRRVGTPTTRAAVGTLTDREHEVLRAIGRGMSNGEIAETFHISELTVKATSDGSSPSSACATEPPPSSTPSTKASSPPTIRPDRFRPKASGKGGSPPGPATPRRLSTRRIAPQGTTGQFAI